MHRRNLVVTCGALLLVAACGRSSWAQDKPPATPAASAAADKPAGDKPDAAATTTDDPQPAELVRLSKTSEIWLDKKRKAVVIDGQVCLREGNLEMFACPKGTKEHESVVSLNCQPNEAHAALLATGAKPGKPVRFDPKYEPASGDFIDIYVLWHDEKGGKHQAKAQQWVKNVKTEKAMEFDWVFAGSGFWKDDDGKEHYQANGGDFICVSNFPSAMLDLPIESSQANGELMFHALTENIPPKGTKVRLVMIPRKKAAESK
ncbi:MAG: YdjY domain-containing protein [Planctomycetaceae bacterium]|nr:YdjY domain-containing protein [Planctomycetaceae bacterium]